jgi:hypothetical protein
LNKDQQISGTKPKTVLLLTVRILLHSHRPFSFSAHAQQLWSLRLAARQKRAATNAPPEF